MRHLSLLLVLSFSLLSLLGAAPAAVAPTPDWPQWRGPERSGVSSETRLLAEWPPAGPPLAWQTVGLGKGFSSLAAAGERLFTLGDRDGAQQLLALSRKDGKLLWKTKVGPLWEDEMGGPRSTPTVDGIDGERVYALGTEGDLVAVDAASGRELWRKNLERDFGGKVMSIWKWSESPLVDGDRLIVTPGAPGALLVALDKKTGKEVWRTAASGPALKGPKGKDGAGYSSAVISQAAGVRQIVQLTGRGLVGVRASDGKLLWSYNAVANDVANISTPVVRGDSVFAATGYQTGAALVQLKRDGQGVAASEAYFLPPKTFQNHHGGFVLIGDHLYGGHGHNRGMPICVEMATGKKVWGGEGATISNGGTGSAAVTAADGRLYFRYQNGRMVLIEATPEGYREKGAFQIPGVDQPSWSHPVVAGGKLYLREQDKLYVYELRRG